MQNTPNYNLRKPDLTDNYAVGDQNTNMDLIDTRMKANADAAASAQTTANAAIPASKEGVANGVATLDATIKVPLAQIPSMDLAHIPAGIPATLLADGSITDTELEYINSLTSNAQTQINAIKTTADAAATNAALTAHEADYTEHIPYGGATTGPANTYALAAPAISALTVGMAVSVKFNVDSTGASTLNWNGKGAKGIKKANGTDVTNLKATGIYTLRYDGANFILQGEGGSGDALASNLLLGKKASTDAGDIVGTMPNRATQANDPSVPAPDAGNGFGHLLPLQIGSHDGALFFNPPAGYYDGSGNNWLFKLDANFIAANIPANMSMFGLAGTGSNIKSRQSGSVTIMATSLNVTIAAVDLTKAIVRITGNFNTTITPNTTCQVNMVSVEFTNSATITFTENVLASTNLIIHWEVIEFNNVKSLQSGSWLTTANGATLSVSSVVVAKSLVFHSEWSGSSANVILASISIELTNSTTLTANAADATGKTVKWFLVEFI